MTGGQLEADTGQYGQAAGLNAVPPAIDSDPLVSGHTPIEQVLRLLGLAANAGDQPDNADSAAEYLRREAVATGAAEVFDAQDADAAAGLAAVTGQDPMSAQQIPQLATAVAGAVAGVLGGALQSIGQIPQQLAQGVQQGIQAGAGMLGPADTGFGDAVDGEPLVDDFGSAATDPGDLGGAFDDAAGPYGAGTFGGGAAAAGLSATTPTALLGPPAVPSPSTSPASGSGRAVAGHSGATAGGAAGIGGLPLIPPGAVPPAAGAERSTDTGTKAGTKRVSVPPVRNGAAVQGRITAADPVAASRVAGRPVAHRRVLTAGGEDTVH